MRPSKNYLIICLLILLGSFSQLAAQRGATGGTGGTSGGSTSGIPVFDLPFETGTYFTAQTQTGPNLDILYHVEMATIWDDSHKIKAPDTSEVAMLGNLPNTVTICDSYPELCKDDSEYGLVLQISGGYLILTGLDSASIAAEGISVGTQLSKGQTLGHLGASNSLHFEVYVPDAGAPLFDASGELIRNWQTTWVGRQQFRYDTHNREPMFCIGSQTRSLNNMETLIAVPCSPLFREGEPGREIMENQLNVTAFPQPAHMAVSLGFEIPVSTRGSLTLLDLTGRSVFNAFRNRALEPGNHQVDLDLHGLKSGIYIYRLETTEGMVTGKIIVSK